MSFRPHQGIILFNKEIEKDENEIFVAFGFRPHQGIILFNLNLHRRCYNQNNFVMFPSPSGDYFI